MNRVRRFLLNAKGTSAAEFALVLPLLSVLLFGFYEAGRLFWNYNIVSNSARDAARFAARQPMACSGGTGTFDSADDEVKVQRLARTGRVAAGGTPLVPGWTSDADIQVAITCIDDEPTLLAGRYETATEIPTVKVTASAPYGVLFGGLFPDLTLSAVAADNAQVWTE